MNQHEFFLDAMPHVAELCAVAANFKWRYTIYQDGVC
jgi:hypothetical protein